MNWNRFLFVLAVLGTALFVPELGQINWEPKFLVFMAVVRILLDAVVKTK